MADDCNETLRELYGYLDGELTPEHRRELQQHIDDCSPCLEAYDFELELRMVVRRHCVEQVPESLRRRIAEALDQPAPGASA